MPDIRAKLSSRLLSTDFSEWNNPRRAKLMFPVFVVVGGGIGILVRYYTGFEDVPLPVLWTLFALFGYVVLALID
jgi:cation transporter-like permease